MRISDFQASFRSSLVNHEAFSACDHEPLIVLRISFAQHRCYGALRFLEEGLSRNLVAARIILRTSNTSLGRSLFAGVGEAEGGGRVEGVKRIVD
jgi:hypothetical protein